MNRSNASRPSPALVLAALALVFAMAGTAVAGPDAISSKITKSKVKKISNKQIAKAAPGLSVDNAENLGGEAPDAYLPLAYGETANGGTGALNEARSANLALRSSATATGWLRRRAPR